MGRNNRWNPAACSRQGVLPVRGVWQATQRKERYDLIDVNYEPLTPREASITRPILLFSHSYGTLWAVMEHGADLISFWWLQFQFHRFMMYRLLSEVRLERWLTVSLLDLVGVLLFELIGALMNANRRCDQSFKCKRKMEIIWKFGC